MKRIIQANIQRFKLTKKLSFYSRALRKQLYGLLALREAYLRCSPPTAQRKLKFKRAYESRIT